MRAGRRGGEAARPLGGQRTLLAVVLTSSFMAVLDTTIVNVALPCAVPKLASRL